MVNSIKSIRDNSKALLEDKKLLRIVELNEENFQKFNDITEKMYKKTIFIYSITALLIETFSIVIALLMSKSIASRIELATESMNKTANLDFIYDEKAVEKFKKLPGIFQTQ